MKRNLIRFSFLALGCILCAAIQAPAQVAGRQVLCPGDTIPAGWIKVDARSDASACPGSGEVWVVETFTNKAPGSAMIVCADQPTPGGWETLGIATSTGQCRGANAAGDNVKSIRRLV
ncbi:MAG TPA: hypothetical protein VF173_14930 [Thermoanaerobaculia bacterium]|nr:hypothetical protein [Thermoanaerobaculia bacterium]